jgi:hypothetical protein
MESITPEKLHTFLEKLGHLYPGLVKLYLLGGSALCLSGNPRVTVDIDYCFDLESGDPLDFECKVKQLAIEMKLALKLVAPAEIIPLPPDAYQRRQFIGRYSNLEAYLFDLYSIALSKIGRGFETDLDDVIFMLREKMITMVELERLFNIILPITAQSTIDPKEFQMYFAEIKRRAARDK